MSQRFRYLRDDRHNPVACIATIVNRENNTVKYAVSVVHSKQDYFVKTRGRQIALGRLNTEPTILELNDKTTGHEIARLVIEDLVLNHLPKHALFHIRSAAKRWLNAPKREANNAEHDTIPAPPLVPNIALDAVG